MKSVFLRANTHDTLTFLRPSRTFEIAFWTESYYGIFFCFFPFFARKEKMPYVENMQEKGIYL